MFKELNQKHRKLDHGQSTLGTQQLSSLLPSHLSLYNQVEICRSASEPIENLTFFEIEDYFDLCYTALFNFTGEVTGCSLVQISPNLFRKNDLAWEEVKELVLDIGNHLTGNFLTKLDKEYDILSYLKAPIVFESNSHVKSLDASKKHRMISMIQKIMHNYDKERIDFTFKYKGTELPFHVVLISTLNLARHD